MATGLGSRPLAPGAVVVDPVANPAAATPWVWTCPALLVAHLLFARDLLTCDANLGNRYPYLVVNDGARDIGHFRATAYSRNLFVTPRCFSTVGIYAGTLTTDTYQQIAIAPNLLLFPGWTITIGVEAFQVGDTLTDCVVTTEQWTAP